MRSKVTIVLLFLNVVLFFYIFQFERDWLRQRSLLEARTTVLGPEAAGIEAFARTARAAPTVRAEKRQGEWWLTAPIEWPANQNAIDRILNELQFLRHETAFPVAGLARTGQTLADYGLADPALTFTFTSAGRDYALKLGDDTKLGNRLYLLSADGERIHVVRDTVAESLDLNLATLRSPAIFTLPLFEVRALTIQSAPPTDLKVRLRRDGTRWILEAPVPAGANKEAVETVLNQLHGLETKTLNEVPAAVPDPATGLATPHYRLTLEGANRRETLLLGAAAPAPVADAAHPEFHARLEDRPTAFTTAVPAALLETLRTAQETLRERRLLDFDPADLTGFTLTAPSQPGQPELVFAQDPAAGADLWQLTVRRAGAAPQTLAADPTVVRGLIERLTILAATRFLSDAPAAADLETYGFNRLERELTLSVASGGGPQRAEPFSLALQIGVRPGEHTAAYARTGAAPYLYEIAPDFLEHAPALARHYRQRLLRELPAGAAITGLKLTDLETQALLFEITSADGAPLTAENVAPAGLEEKKRQALAALLGQMRMLRAQRFTADTFAPDHADHADTAVPWRYRLEVRLALTSGAAAAQTLTSTLLLTERLGGTTQLAGTEEFGGLNFAITPELMDALFALTYAPPPTPEPPPATPAAPPAGSH